MDNKRFSLVRRMVLDKSHNSDSVDVSVLVVFFVLREGAKKRGAGRRFLPEHRYVRRIGYGMRLHDARCRDSEAGGFRYPQMT